MNGASGNRFPRRSWVPGYHVADVDTLIDRIEATLGGVAGPGQAVTGSCCLRCRPLPGWPGPRPAGPRPPPGTPGGKWIVVPTRDG